MMEHYDIREDPAKNGNIKYYAKVKWDDNVKSILEWKEARNHDGKFYKDYTIAECGCCGTNYAYLPSDLNCIIEKGYCSWCILYRLGLVDYINAYRSATYDEVHKKLNDPYSSFSPSEVRILMKGKK